MNVKVTDLHGRAIKLAQNQVKLAISGARGPVGLDLLGDPADWEGMVPQLTGIGRQAVPVLPGSGADETLRADLLSTTGASNVKNRLSGTTGATDQLVSDLFSEIITPTRWGAKGDGSFDDTTGFADAINDANDRANGGTVVIPSRHRFRLTDALPAIGDHVNIVGFGNAGSLLSIEHDGPAFTWTGYGGGLENLRIDYPAAPDPAAAVMFIQGGNGQNLRNLRINNVAKLAQMGDATLTGSALTVSQIKGNGANIATPLFDLHGGAGLLMSEIGVYVAGVDPPTNDRISSMSSAEGRSFLKTNGKTFDTILLGANSVLERWWRVFDMVTAGTGDLLLNIFVDETTVCDFISDDVYHFEAATGSGIVNWKVRGYADSWSGCAVNVIANGAVRSFAIDDLVTPFAGHEAISITGLNASDFRITNPLNVASNRLDDDRADILIAGGTHFKIEGARSGVNDAAGGSDWQGNYGISIAGELSHYTITDCDCDGATEPYDFPENTSPNGSRFIKDNNNATYAGFRTDGIFAMPESAVAWFNTTGFEIEVTVCGGTVTTIQKNAHVVGIGQATCVLLPGDSLYIEYSVAPNEPMFYIKP